MELFFLLVLTPLISPLNSLDVPKYLEQFGYASPSMYFNNDISDAIANFQETFALNVTGVADKETMALMETPRCGNPDNEGVSYGYTKKWPKKELTYYFENFSEDLEEDDIRELIRRAFQFWADVSSLSFSEKEGGDIIIAFGARKHYDSKKGKCSFDFDGRGKVLAHAFYPTDGRVHFDDDEKFAKSRWWPIFGTNFLWVATHEIGHVLGLSHDKKDKGSIMYPVYRSIFSRMKLSENDIYRINALYD